MSLLTSGQSAAGAPGSVPAGASGTSGGAGNQPGQPGAADWRSFLPDDIRGEAVFADIKAKDEKEALALLGKNYVHAQRLVGQKGIIPPGDKATPEEISNFYRALGRPEKPEDYAVNLPEGVTEAQLDKARIDSWRKELHAQGLTKKQAEAVIAGAIKEEFGAVTAKTQQRATEMQNWELGLKQELGAKYDETVNFARLGLREFGNDNILAVLESSGLGSHPEVVKMFAAIGQKLSDDKARGGQGLPSVNSPEAAQHALNVFNQNEDNVKALFDRKHPRHEQVKAERTKLFKLAFPGMTDAKS